LQQPLGRRAILDGLRKDPRVPVLILGGGINGAGLLRELALQGVGALLVDKADFAAGATSKSSRMIHGGLRYLEHREFALVRESLFERNRLLENAPHYVRPLRTTIPLFSHLGGAVRSSLIFLGLPVRPGGRGALLVKGGLAFYDLVTRKDRMTPTHYLTGREASLRDIPGLDPRIVATATYWDAVITQAERLCLELIQDAARAEPRSCALNYVRPVGAEGAAVVLRDEVAGGTVRVEPRVVVNATGAWVDLANAALGIETHFMGGTKGSHLVVESPALLHALGDRMVYYQHTDGRVCIVFPFMGKVIMGSTDIRTDDPDAAACDEGEVAYMLETLRGVFPGCPVGRPDIVLTFCGVRPLPASRSAVTANISRAHSIEGLEPDGNRPFPVYSLVGGKWTTFRALAEQAADRVLAGLGRDRRRSTAHEPIGGGRGFPRGEAERARWIERVAQASGLPEARVGALLERYGTAAEAWAAECAAEGERPLQALPDYTDAEVRRVAAREAVVRLADLVYRRSTIGLAGGARPEALRELAAAIAPILGWDEARQEREAAETLAPRPAPSPA
jgi:glycerol-3-phosphate dehydrogenase